MTRQRPQLGTPFGTDGPWLAAILEALGDLHDLLDARLAAAPEPEVVRVSEPDPDRPPVAVPVREPAPDAPPPAAQPKPEPEPDDEPEEERRSLPPPPPRAGRGSGLDAWQAFADIAEVAYSDDASRADIIAACESAKVIPADS